MKATRLLLALLLAGATSGGFRAAAAASPTATTPKPELFPDPVVAKGRGFVIHRSEVDESVAGYKSALASQGQSVPDDQREAVALRILDRMVMNRILQQRATEADRKKAKELADKFVTDTKARANSEESYRRQLLASGVKPDVFETRALEQAIVETVLDRELKSTLTVPDAQVREYYDSGVDVQARELEAVAARLEKSDSQTVFYADAKKKLEDVKKANLARMERLEQIRVNLLVIYTIDRLTREDLADNEKEVKKQLATRLLARLKAGEDWGKLAREYSDDPQVSRNSGEYLIVRDAPALPDLAELKALMFTLPLGEISDLIPTKLGFYIVKVLDKTPAGKLPFVKAEKDIRDLLLTQEVQKRIPDYLTQLRKEYAVEISLSATK